MLVNGGFSYLINILHGSGWTPWLPGQAQIRVGTGTAAVVPGNDNLTAAIGNTVQELDVNGNVITGYATFGPDAANMPWREWGLFNTPSVSTDSFKMLNRVQKDMGTKVQGQTWKISIRITINAT